MRWLVFVFALTFVTNRAHANHEGRHIEGLQNFALGFLVVSGNLMLTIFDLSSPAAARRGYGLGEASLAALEVGGGLLLANERPRSALAYTMVGWGAALLIHGVWVAIDPAPPPDGAVHLAPLLTTDGQGAVVGLSGTF